MKPNNYKQWYREVYLNSPHWREVSERAKNRVGRKCEQCGLTAKELARDGWSLEVHHRSYKNLGHEYDGDLECLCHLCHQSRHHTLEELIERMGRKH